MGGETAHFVLAYAVDSMAKARELNPARRAASIELAPAGRDSPSGRVVYAVGACCNLRPFLNSDPFDPMAKSDKVPARRFTTRLDGYVYRRPVRGTELIPAIGAGVAAGLATFYVVKLFLQRTPLLPEERRLGKHHALERLTG
jgi:hypothetical protein